MKMEDDKDFHDAIWDAPIINRKNKLDTVMGRIIDELMDQIDDYETLPIQNRPLKEQKPSI